MLNLWAFLRLVHCLCKHQNSFRVFSWGVSPPLQDRQNVVFLHVIHNTMCLSRFWWFQEVLFVLMSFSNNVNICCTHVQSFKNCGISVVTIVTKWIIDVSLVVTHRKTITLREMHYSCALDDLCLLIIKYSKCVIRVEVLSLLT